MAIARRANKDAARDGDNNGRDARARRDANGQCATHCASQAGAAARLSGGVGAAGARAQGRAGELAALAGARAAPAAEEIRGQKLEGGWPTGVFLNKGGSVAKAGELCAERAGARGGEVPRVDAAALAEVAEAERAFQAKGQGSSIQELGGQAAAPAELCEDFRRIPRGLLRRAQGALGGVEGLGGALEEGPPVNRPRRGARGAEDSEVN
ncbi:unnamed protein product [Prorocentrum cordatum]|uniref:Uncharacterized protein n=1 Tax=Prorocentrum cordatum TaxID=2364126 RepID=A0ABN9WTT5_9DINO|nr:unnamed protein product [Polarella glacialis]